MPVIRNTTANEPPPPSPVKPDGEQYQYGMIFDEGRWRAFADTPAELVGYLLKGYAELPPGRPRISARLRYASQTKIFLQSSLIDGNHIDLYNAQEKAILTSFDDVPVAVERWHGPIPLVLLTPYYEPIGPLPRPETTDDSIIWLDPTDDLPLLQSLHRAGLIIFGQRRNSSPSAE